MATTSIRGSGTSRNRGARTGDFSSSRSDFAALSLKDLLDARDLFHLHLMNKPHVVGTAVGLYRSRKPGVERSEKKTLANSEVRDNSWPALLVFVDQWVSNNAFGEGRRFDADEFIPPRVYMPNGLIVPICVIAVERDPMRPEQAISPLFPTNLIGGGFPVLAEVQGTEHVASIGCMVSDGHTVYALTNRHVCGAAGEVLYSVLGGNRVRIGVSSSKQATDLPFGEIYPGWPGRDVFVNLDIGLIEVDDRNRWTTQVYGIGELGELLDLSVDNMSLKIVGMPVRAFGCASREMRGEVCALFYRYKAVGGFEYVADFLIGPHAGEASLGTRPGDSGTIWVLDDDKGSRRPFAIQWGGQQFLADGRQMSSSYALATCLSTVCTRLDVDVLRDWNIDQPDYWGAVGHYGIATNAIAAVRDPALSKLMTANLERISFQTPDITKSQMAGLSKREFVPLADVPDMVWKVGPYKRGGMSSPEHANHFADMDRVIDPPIAGGTTLLEICKDRPANVDVAVWQKYYDAVTRQYPEHESRGLLAFRVWQFYQGMVAYARAGDAARFVCAAGIVSHYVGDACQPLHVSYLFNGDPDKQVPGTVRDSSGKHPGTVPEATGVHAAYEDVMVDYHVDAIMQGVQQGIAAAKPALDADFGLYTGGHSAAVATVDLIEKTFALIPPRSILDAFVAFEDQHPKDRAESMWNADAPDSIGARTIQVMTQGCLHLAQLWDSAWAEGGGGSRITNLTTIDEAALEEIYRDRNFMPSNTLDTIGPLLQAGSSGSATRPARGVSPAPSLAPPPGKSRRTGRARSASKPPRGRRSRSRKR
jgi:hypothetical protein